VSLPSMPDAGCRQAASNGKKGVVVTVHHGVQRNEDIKVLFDGDRVVPAKLIGRDPGTDLAVPG